MIRFYFDFASPYAYFALRPLEALAAEHGLPIDYRPVLLWAVFKELGIASPLDVPARRAYLFADMKRSAEFHGVAYQHPDALPFSSHAAARLFHAALATHPAAASRLAHALFDALFVHGHDITRPDVLETAAITAGLEPEAARQAASGATGRPLLAAAIAQAVADNICGSPTMCLDDEQFFGADRVPQLAWRLAQGWHGNCSTPKQRFTAS